MDTVELRVHGVSGTPPQDLLARPLVTQVAGDATAGFYRPQLPGEADDGPDGPPLEGYSWGGITSGSPGRALWLLLLPFTLINVAPRLRPGGRAGEQGARVRVVWLTCQWLALAMTMTLALAFVGIGVDLIGWQCDRASTCAQAGPNFLFDWIGHMARQRRLLVGALLPLVALGGLWAISARSVSRYEAVDENRPDIYRYDPARRADYRIEVGVDSPMMWRGRFRAPRLLQIHLQAGAAVTVAAVAWAVDESWRWVVLGVCALLVADCAALLAVPAVVSPLPHPTLTRYLRGVWAVLGAAAATLAAPLLFANPELSGPQQAAYLGRAAGLHHYSGTVFGLFAAQMILIIALVVALPTRQRGGARPHQGLYGYGTVIVAGLGTVAGGLYSAGAYVFAAAYLNTGSLRPSFDEVRSVTQVFDMPEAIRDAALAYTVSIAVLVLVGAVVAVWFVRARLRIRPRTWPLAGDEFAADYPGRDAGGSRGKDVLRTFWTARLTDQGGRLLAGLLLPGAVLTVWIALAYLGGHLLGVDELRRQTDVLAGMRRSGLVFRDTGWLSAYAWQGFGAYLIVITVVGLVALGALAYRVPATRRSVGTLWDIFSFWPRSVHPMAAPCYAERTVPDLSTRLRAYLTGEPVDGLRADRVVLAAHSQGSVISAAVLLQLRNEDTPALQRVSFLSYGCVLRRLYARYFRVYFGPATLTELAAALAEPDGHGLRWRNLWRHSDYLGGPVGFGPDQPAEVTPGLLGTADVKLIDPPFAPRPGDLSSPRAGGHSGYPGDPVFQQTVQALI